MEELTPPALDLNHSSRYRQPRPLSLQHPAGIASYTARDSRHGDTVVLLHFSALHSLDKERLDSEYRQYCQLSEHVALPAIRDRLRVGSDEIVVLTASDGFDPIDERLPPAQRSALLGFLAEIELRGTLDRLLVTPSQIFVNAATRRFIAYGLVLGDHLIPEGAAGPGAFAALFGAPARSARSFRELAALLRQPVGTEEQQRRTLLYMARRATAQSNWDQAREALGAARSLGPASPALVAEELRFGVRAEDQAVLQRALEELTSLAKSSPIDPELQRLAAAAKDRLGRSDEALQDLTTLINIRASGWEKALLLRAAILEDLGRIDEAVADLRLAYREVPDEDTLRDLLRLSQRVHAPEVAVETWLSSQIPLSNPAVAAAILRGLRLLGQPHRAAALARDTAARLPVVPDRLLATFKHVFLSAFDTNREWLVFLGELVQQGKAAPEVLGQAYFDAGWYDRVIALAARESDNPHLQDLRRMAQVVVGPIDASLRRELEQRWRDMAPIPPGFLARVYAALGCRADLARLRKEAVERGCWTDEEEARFTTLCSDGNC
ncbi:MAG: hypothetical protein KatS3mg102_0721 [Planctomycetota bacterium]|nr:MAG: hypothetical protein KatS3mg102_0721 [Planctomycetota bacterium]